MSTFLFETSGGGDGIVQLRPFDHPRPRARVLAARHVVPVVTLLLIVISSSGVSKADESDPDGPTRLSVPDLECALDEYRESDEKRRSDRTWDLLRRAHDFEYTQADVDRAIGLVVERSIARNEEVLRALLESEGPDRADDRYVVVETVGEPLRPGNAVDAAVYKILAAWPYATDRQVSVGALEDLRRFQTWLRYTDRLTSDDEPVDALADWFETVVLDNYVYSRSRHADDPLVRRRPRDQANYMLWQEGMSGDMIDLSREDMRLFDREDGENGQSPPSPNDPRRVLSDRMFRDVEPWGLRSRRYCADGRLMAELETIGSVDTIVGSWRLATSGSDAVTIDETRSGGARIVELRPRPDGTFELEQGGEANVVFEGPRQACPLPEVRTRPRCTDR